MELNLPLCKFNLCKIASPFDFLESVLPANMLGQLQCPSLLNPTVTTVVKCVLKDPRELIIYNYDSTII